jgi:hypothetical protein
MQPGFIRIEWIAAIKNEIVAVIVEASKKVLWDLRHFNGWGSIWKKQQTEPKFYEAKLESYTFSGSFHYVKWNWSAMHQDLMDLIFWQNCSSALSDFIGIWRIFEQKNLMVLRYILYSQEHMVGLSFLWTPSCIFFIRITLMSGFLLAANPYACCWIVWYRWLKSTLLEGWGIRFLVKLGWLTVLRFHF